MSGGPQAEGGIVVPEPRILATLWRHRVQVAVGFALAMFVALMAIAQISFFPPSIHKRQIAFSTAKTTVLVDSPRSSLADVNRDITPMTIRANVFARLVLSPAVLTLIAQRSGIPAIDISARGPFNLNETRVDQEPTAEERSSQILSEGAKYRMRFDAQPDLPIITIYAQAPTTKQAVALASGGADALQAYLNKVQAQQGTPSFGRVSIRVLGRAQGGVVNSGSGKQIAAVGFVAVFMSWCLIVLFMGDRIEGFYRALWRLVRDPNRADISTRRPARPRKDPQPEPSDREPRRAPTAVANGTSGENGGPYGNGGSSDRAPEEAGRRILRP